jgi:transcriptional regulator with XRE-family HTH domain
VLSRAVVVIPHNGGGTVPDDEYDVAVRDFLRIKRLERRLTQRDVAALLGKPPSYVAKIEVGERRCTVSDFVRFSQALKFDLRSAIRRIAEAKPGP